jgi:D-galactarolactone cycloisomerase
MAYPAIRITEVKVHRLSAPLGERFGYSLAWVDRRVATLVEVSTDAGLTGWGDGGFGGGLLAANPSLVIGRSPFEAAAIYDALRLPPRLQSRPGPQTCGGLDTALWDLAGQALGLPVSALFGRRCRDRVQPYCTALYRKDAADLPRALAAEALEWKAQGFRILKMKVGLGPALDYANVRAVREAIGGETALGIDANCAYDAATAAALARRLEPFDIAWFEEPLLADNFEGYARLRAATAIPLAGGETFPADRLITEYIQPRLVDILQPEIEIIGLTGALRLSHLCWLNHMRLVPHNWGTAVRTAAILHWMAAVPAVTEAIAAPPALFEFDRTESPFRDAVVEDPPRLDSDGLVAVPGGPGLGIRVIPEAVARFREELIVIK